MISNSAEAAFKVLGTTNGDPDNTLTLRNLLLKRFKQFEQNNKNVTVDDLLLTHNIFLTSSFKPFISTSSIYLKTDLPPNFNLNTFVNIELDNIFSGDFVNDMYLDVVIDPIGNEDSGNYKIRYTDYPGIRLIKKVELWLNGKKTDSYNQEDMLFYMFNELDYEKRKAFEKCVGHSGPITSTVYKNDKEVNESFNIYNGYQTYKTRQEKLHMTIPLLFWFNKSVEKSYPVLKQESISINHSRNYIKIWFMGLDNLIQGGEYSDSAHTTSEDSNAIPVSPYFKSTYTLSEMLLNPFFNLKKPTYNISLYAHNIYVNDEIRNFYTKYIDMYMVSTYQSFHMNVHKLEEVKIKDLSDMTPYIYVAFRLEENEESFDKWHKFTVSTKNWYPVPSYEWTPIHDNNIFVLKLRKAYYDLETPIITDYALYFDTLLYANNKYPDDYLRYKAQIRDDNYKYNSNGIYLIPFCRKFTDTELTGHINFSRIQEVILKYTLSDSVKNKKLKMYISGKKNNLLTIKSDIVSLKWNSYML